MTTIQVSCRVNNMDMTLDVSPFATLATALRTSAGLTATRLGCEEGVCGSCTVLVNGRSLRSCLTLAAQVEGAEIATVEGYAQNKLQARIQAAFIKHYSAQCGFCTSGMMAVIYEFLTDQTIDDHADEKTIRQRLSAVVCRCTGYQPIVAAVQDVARELSRDDGLKVMAASHG